MSFKSLFYDIQVFFNNQRPFSHSMRNKMKTAIFMAMKLASIGQVSRLNIYSCCCC